MIIWIITFALLALFALLGYFLGSVRALVMLVGVLLAGLLALPLGPHLRPLFPQLGVTNTVWLWFWPPVAAFGLVWLLATVAALFADLPIRKHFKYRSDDVQRVRWERLNQRVGAYVGGLAGILATLWLGVGLYFVGYLTCPFANEEADPAWLRYLNKARADMAAVGMDRLMGSLDPMPKKYYQVVDILGFLYVNNPAELNRLAAYPPFLTYGERPEIKELADDKDYRELLIKRPGLVEIVNNARTQALINNGDLWQELGKVDLDDFRRYMETGKSAKYDASKILGRWSLDVYEVLLRMKKKKPDITKNELEEIQIRLALMANGSTLLATTDNKVVIQLKGQVIDQAKFAQQRAAAAAAAAAAAPPQPRTGRLGAGGVYGLSAEMRRRYQNPNVAPPSSAPPPPAAPPTGQQPIPMKEVVKTYQGTWEGEGDSYQLALQGDKGESQTADAMLSGDQLVFKAFGQEFVFVKE